jgi:hypothetical protein
MEPQNVSFKVIFKAKIRRFEIAQDVSTSLDYLKEKLSSMFLELDQKEFGYGFFIALG